MARKKDGLAYAKEHYADLVELILDEYPNLTIYVPVKKHNDYFLLVFATRDKEKLRMRYILYLPVENYLNMLEQVKPHGIEEWWDERATKNYGVYKAEIFYKYDKKKDELKAWMVFF